jgi:DNA-directed RNA polymerase subunit RPC12/RpoP
MGYKNVCFDCKKAFNQGTDLNNIRESKCPDCGQLMKQVTHRFRPPKQKDTKQWEVAKFLMESGFLYEHVYERIYEIRGITVLANYATYPENMRDAKEFVEKYKAQAETE